MGHINLVYAQKKIGQKNQFFVKCLPIFANFWMPYLKLISSLHSSLLINCAIIKTYQVLVQTCFNISPNLTQVLSSLFHYSTQGLPNFWSRKESGLAKSWPRLDNAWAHLGLDLTEFWPSLEQVFAKFLQVVVKPWPSLYRSWPKSWPKPGKSKASLGKSLVSGNIRDVLYWYMLRNKLVRKTNFS